MVVEHTHSLTVTHTHTHMNTPVCTTSPRASFSEYVEKLSLDILATGGVWDLGKYTRNSLTATLLHGPRDEGKKWSNFYFVIRSPSHRDIDVYIKCAC